MPNAQKGFNKHNDDLLDHIANLEEYISFLEEKIMDLTDSSSVIFDVPNFKFRLQIDGLLTSELEDEIDSYMKYYNELIEED